MLKKNISPIGLFYGWFVCLFLLLSPFNFFYENIAMLDGSMEYGGWGVALTPVYIKIYKDFFVFISLVFLLFAFFGNKISACSFKPIVVKLSLVFFIFTIFSAMLSIGRIDMVTIAVGVRAYWTLLLVVVGATVFYEKKNLYIVIVAVFLLHLFVQVYQEVLDLGFPVFAEHRSPGVFIVPTTAGAFAILIYYFAESRNSILFKMLSLISLYLSKSTIGLIVFAIYFCFKIASRVGKKNSIIVFAIIFPLVGLFFFYYFGEISGRGNAAYLSLAIRLGYVLDVVYDLPNLMFGRGMGIATSNAVISGLDDAIVADNTITGAILNMGWLAAVFLSAIIFASWYVFKSKLLFLMFFLYSMVSNMFEMTPVVHILMLLLGAHARDFYFNSQFLKKKGNLP